MTDLNRTALPSRTDGTVEKTDTLVVGAGQAGVAMSEHLSRLGVPHCPRAQPHRRGLAQRTLGFAGGQRPGLARPLPGNGIRHRSRRFPR